MSAPHFAAFSSREDASQAAAALLRAALAGALREFASAQLMVSGGSSPVRTFEILAEAPLDLDDVTVGLVDERFVPPDHDASNEGLVRRHLLRGRGRRAEFQPMFRSGLALAACAREADRLYAHGGDIDAIFLGMGEDGHTASWFPGAERLPDLIDPRASAWVDWIDATGAPAAGTTPERLTLTLPAVASARHGVLLIFGKAKRVVYEEALGADPLERPVRAAVDALGARLTVIWAP